jgi:hypothetical protein
LKIYIVVYGTMPRFILDTISSILRVYDHLGSTVANTLYILLLLSCYRLALIVRFLFLSFSFFGWSLDCWASPSFVLLARSRFGGPSKSSTATARKGREPERWRRRWRLGAHTDLNSASQIPNSRAASLSGRRRGVMPRRRRWRRPFDAPTTSSTRRALQAPPPPHPPLPPTRLA